MFLLSLPLPTTPFPTFSQYFPPFYSIFLHFRILFNPICKLWGGGRNGRICKYYSSYILQGSLFPGSLHFALVSSASHDIFCIFAFHVSMVFIPFLVISILHFPMLLLSFPAFLEYFLRCFPVFSHVFALSSGHRFFKVQFAQIWLKALNIHKTSSPSQLQTWLASPLLSVRLVTRTTTTCILSLQ